MAREREKERGKKGGGLWFPKQAHHSLLQVAVPLATWTIAGQKGFCLIPSPPNTSDFSKNNKLSVDEMRRQLYICGAVGAGAQY